MRKSGTRLGGEKGGNGHSCEKEPLLHQHLLHLAISRVMDEPLTE